MPRWINLPNLLTLLRLALVPFIVASVLAGRHVAALALFFIAAMTDVLDGAAARRLGVLPKPGLISTPSPISACSAAFSWRWPRPASCPSGWW